jgi:two-component sensor histidine kinase
MPKNEQRKGSPDQVLKKALKEKDFLVKEVHHRVRNNLQLIISLLDLQASFLNDAKQCAAFKDSQHRIKALYLVYDTIDRTEDASRLDCRQFLDRLFESLFATYGVKNLATRLKIAEDTQVSPATASLFGLILNELISNSILHAFPGGRTGSIEVDIRPTGANTAVTLRDDGIGLPVDFDFRNSQSLGFQLLTKLVGQLKGSIDQLAGPGAAFLIQFPSAD